MSKFKNNKLIEKCNQLNKAIEIVGGKEFLNTKITDDIDMAEYIISSVFEGEEVKFNFAGEEYSIPALFKAKLEYEKNFLRNKGKAIDSIAYKIKKYDTSLDSEIRKYKKSSGIEEYNKIYDIVEKRYRRDINMLVLNSMDSNLVEKLSAEEEDKYYGEYLTQKKKIRKSVTAIILLIEAILCFLVPLSLAVWLLISKLQTVNVDTATFVDTITNLADWIRRKTEYDLLSKENISSIASILPGIGQFLMGGISSFAVNLFVLVFVLYFMLIGGTKMEQYIYELLPFSDSNKKHVMNEINMIVRANAIGIPLLAIIQGAIATLGYYLFDAPSALLFGFLTCFATVIPIVGTTLVWFPLAAYMAISGDWPHAIGLLLYCGLIVTNIDNLIRFILQKKMADTHPLITIFGVVIGLSLFGFMGVIFGPLLISIFILCVNIFKEQYLK